MGLSQLVHALQASPAGQGLRLSAWNVRWLVSGRDQGPAKRECIRRWLDTGRVVALSETHWWEADAAVWANHFPGAVVVSACAVPGPNGGPRGGVALIIPDRYHVVSHTVLADGYGVEAEVLEGEQHRRLVAAYLPPGGQCGLGCLPPWSVA